MMAQKPCRSVTACGQLRCQRYGANNGWVRRPCGILPTDSAREIIQRRNPARFKLVIAAHRYSISEKPYQLLPLMLLILQKAVDLLSQKLRSKISPIVPRQCMTFQAERAEKLFVLKWFEGFSVKTSICCTIKKNNAHELCPTLFLRLSGKYNTLPSISLHRHFRIVPLHQGRTTYF